MTSHNDGLVMGGSGWREPELIIVRKDEWEQLRAFRTAVEQAFQPYYFNGVEVDGKQINDVLDEIHAALDASPMTAREATHE